MGAAGRTGRLLTEAALARGHQVSAVVHSSPLTWQQPNLSLANLRIAKGDALSATDMAIAIEGHDVIVSILGRRSRSNRTLLDDGAAAMLKAMEGQRPHRYIVVSSGLLFANKSLRAMALRLVFRNAIADCSSMERRIVESHAMWTIVRPPRLAGGDASKYRVEIDARQKGALSLTRASLASFLLDEAESCRYPRTIVGLG